MRVNLTDGRTIKCSLTNDEQGQPWKEIESDDEAQDTIRAIALDQPAEQVVVVAPRGFAGLAFTAEQLDNGDGPSGQRVEVQADNVRLVVTSWRSGMVRVDLRRTEKPENLAQFKRQRR